MELLLESRDGEITALNEQVLRLGQRNRVLESALGELQERIRGLESGLGRKEVEVLGLEGRLGEKEEEASALAAKNKSFREQIDGLCEAVTGLERQRDLWVAKEATLVGEIQRLGFVVEEKNGALSDAVADAAKNKEMCRSIEAAMEQRIRAKDLELDAAKKEIEVKDSELVRFNDDVLELREKSRGMQATIDRLEDTVAGQSKRLTSKEAEATGLEAKICVLQAKLGESEEEIESLARSRKGLIEQNELLKQTVQKFEERRADWIKREESLTREVQELAISLEEKCSSVNAAVKEVKDEKDRCKSLGSCLTEKVEELKCSRKKCEDLETSLEICEGELRLLQDENNRQQKALKLAAAESRIESLTARLKEKTEELEALTVDSRVKDETLAALTEEAESLRRENKKIGSAAQRLQKAMESRSAEAAEQMQDLSGKIAQLQNDLHDKIEDLRIIQGENEELQQEAQRFRVCLEEFEIRKNNWEQKEHDLTDRVSEMSSTIEDRAAALASAGIEIEHLKNKCRDLEEALEKEVDRLKLCMEERHRFESGLNSSLQEIEEMRAAAALEAERFEQKLSVSESRLKDAIGRMNLKAEELEIMSKNLEEKDAQLGCISDELGQIREVKVGLDAAAEASRTSIEALEALLKTKQAELSSIDEKLANVESKLCEREESLESAARENVEAQKQIAALMQAVAELEEKRDCSKRNQDDLARELRELELELENKCSALNRSELDAKVAKETCEAMQTSIETLEITLKKTVEELDSCIAERQLLGISLASCEQKLADLQIERDQVENLKEALIAVEYQLKESIGQLQAKSGEIELVVKDLRNKETQLTSAREDLQQLTEKNSLLDFSVQTLQVKVSTIAEELKRSEARGAQLFGDLTTAESKLAELAAEGRSREPDQREDGGGELQDQGAGIHARGADGVCAGQRRETGCVGVGSAAARPRRGLQGEIEPGEGREGAGSAQEQVRGAGRRAETERGGAVRHGGVPEPC